MEEIVIRDITQNDSVEEIAKVMAKGFLWMEKVSGIYEDLGEYPISYEVTKHDFECYHGKCNRILIDF